MISKYKEYWTSEKTFNETKTIIENKYKETFKTGSGIVEALNQYIKKNDPRINAYIMYYELNPVYTSFVS